MITKGHFQIISHEIQKEQIEKNLMHQQDELSKFKLCPSSFMTYLIKRLLDFQKHNNYCRL